MDEDLISIIIPAFNCESFILDTINSVIQQTYTNWEIILVNDNSTDHTCEIINNFNNKKISVINLEKNVGAAEARNIGINNVKGRYICFLDSDDVWKKNKLELQVKFMKHENAVFSFTDYEFANEEAIGTGKIVKVPKNINYKQALRNTTIFTSTVMIDTNTIPKELIYMPNIKSEDTATWWGILKKGIIANGLNENLTLYRRSKGTLSSNKLEAIQRIWYLYRKVENLNIMYSIYCFILYAIHAVRRRV